MKHTMRILTFLMLAVVVGRGQAWADALSNPRVKFVYSGEQHGTAFASEANGNGVVTITITPDGDWRCIDGDVTAKVTANTNMAQAPRRTQAEVQIGDAIGVTFEETNVFTLTLPDNAYLNATVTISFSEKLDNVFTVSLDNWTYGEAPKTPQVENNQSGNEPTYTYSNAENGDYSSTVPSIAGTHWVKASIAASTDYKACESEPVAFIIAKAPLTVTANDHSIFYGNAAANNGVTYDGFVNNEDESVLGGTLTYTYSNANGAYGEDNDAPGSYQITPGGLASNNYDITFIPGVLEVFQFIVEVKVVDATNSEEIGKETTIQVLDLNGNVVIDYNGNDVIVTSAVGAFVIDRLKTGVTYTLRETKAPEGYVLPTGDITFTIDNEGTVTPSGSTTTDDFGKTVLLLKNSKTHVEVSVVDIADGDELVGAHVQVLDGDGNVVKDLEGNNVEWNSTTENHVIEGLKTGEEYTLRETIAPEGYVLPTDFTFIIDETGKITSTGSVTQDGVLLVENTKTRVEVSVVDIANREEVLSGGHIQVLDSDNQVADEWDTTTENYVSEGLKIGEKYTLHESVAPNGYLPFTDNTFTIAADGTITYSGTMTEDKVLLVENSIPVDVSVAVFWNDGNNTEGFRPESVIVRLKKGDETIGSKELNTTNNWTGTFADLYKYDDAGDEITYIVTEDDVENYTTNVVGYTITNQRDIEETEATVKVVWVDGNDELHNRPESVTATLSDNTHTVTMNAENDWTATVTGLQKYSNATPIVYTWTQDEDALPEGYKQTNSVVAEAVTTFTDSYYPDVTVTITGHHNETTYDGTEHAVSGYEAVSSYSLYTADDFTFSGMASASQTNAGTAYMGLAASQFTNDNENYEGKVTFVIAENGDGYQTISPAPLTVKADDVRIKFGEDAPAFSVHYGDNEGNNLVNNENENVLGGTLDFECDYTTGNAIGDYAITPYGLTSDNYDITFVPGTLTVVPADLQIFAANSTNLWTTHYDSYERTVPNGCSAWAVTGISNNAVTVSEITGTTMPADTPLLISRNEAGADAVSAEYPVLAGSSTAPATNLLQIASSTNQPKAFQDYVLYQDAFYLVSGGTLADGKVFLPAGGSTTAPRLNININGEVTSLTPAPSPTGEGSGYWYTIDGRKVNGQPLKKGLYIKNGKKEVVR